MIERLSTDFGDSFFMQTAQVKQMKSGEFVPNINALNPVINLQKKLYVRTRELVDDLVSGKTRNSK